MQDSAVQTPGTDPADLSRRTGPPFDDADDAIRAK